MPHKTPLTVQIRSLDGGYSREARSLLYQAYRHEPTFSYMFESDRTGYEQRVRATIRELVRQHFLEDLPALGLMADDRLVGIALIAPPQRRLDITESWSWRLRMLMSTGFGCTQRYLDYHAAVLSCLPTGAYHLLPLMGIHPQFQGRQLGHQLLAALHQWCAEDPNSQGLVLNSGNARYIEYYKRLVYEEMGELAIGPIVERVFFHPNPQPLERSIG